MITYKVVKVSEHDGISIEESLNYWSSLGWKFNSMESEHMTQLIIFEKEERVII